MPEICRFYGIVIKMFFDDHQPPHFHVQYGDQQAIIDIRNLALISGRLAPRALGLVTEWAAQHREDLTELWDQARAAKPLRKLDPLP